MAEVRDHILLTGASGRVGRMVLRHWPKARLKVTAQYRTVRPGALCWDPRDGPRALVDHIARAGTVFRAVVMLAGVTPGPGKDLALNRAIAEATLDAAARAGITRVLLASSSAVYGVGEAMHEDAPCAPVNAYGAAKLDMEAACVAWRARGIETCALRIGNVAGADALLLNVARNGPDRPVTLDIFADGGGPLRSYIGPGTLAEVLETLCLLDGPPPPVLNVAAPQPVPMATLAKAAGAGFRARPAPASAHQRITLDCRRLAALHGFRPADSDPAEMVRQWHEAEQA